MSTEIKNKNHGNASINIGSDYLNIKTSTIVKMEEQFVIVTEDGPIYLTVDITADFMKVPEKYHEIFLNVLTSKYMNKVSFGDNPFSECRPIIKRKWWQIWKSEYFTR